MHLLGRHVDQFIQRRAAIPCVRNMQLARWFTEPCNGEDRGHRRPRDTFAALRSVIEAIETQHPPQSPGQPDVAEVARAFQQDAAQFDENWLVVARRALRCGGSKSGQHCTVWPCGLPSRCAPSFDQASCSSDDSSPK